MWIPINNTRYDSSCPTTSFSNLNQSPRFNNKCAHIKKGRKPKYYWSRTGKPTSCLDICVCACVCVCVCNTSLQSTNNYSSFRRGEMYKCLCKSLIKDCCKNVKCIVISVNQRAATATKDWVLQNALAFSASVPLVEE